MGKPENPAEADKQVEFFFEESINYAIVPANGAWIGPTPRGELKIDFFVESLKVPDKVTHLITDDRHLGPEINQIPGRQFVRTLQMGVLLEMDAAEDLAKLILEKVGEFRNRSAKESK